VTDDDGNPHSPGALTFEKVFSAIFDATGGSRRGRLASACMEV